MAKDEKVSAEEVVRDIRRQTRRKYSAEEKIRIVLEGLRGEESIAELCRREGINPNMYYKWSKEFLCVAKARGYDKCAQKEVRCDYIDPQVVNALFRAAALMPSDIEAAVNAAISQRAEYAATLERMQEIEAIIKRIDLSWEHGFMSEEEYIQKRRARQVEIEALKPVDYDELRTNAFALKNFPQHGDSATDDEARQALIDTIVKAVVIKDEEVQAIILRGNTALLLGDGGHFLDLRGRVPYTRHKMEIPIPPPLSSVTEERYPDKELLRQRILELRSLGLSYREIGDELQIHCTTVRNIALKGLERKQKILLPSRKAKDHTVKTTTNTGDLQSRE